MKLTMSDYKKPVLGWREWVSFPELKVKDIKAKIDTGARTSALHVTDMVFTKIGRTEYVEFVIYPLQKKQKPKVKAKAKLLERRPVRSSNGQITIRPVIETKIKIADIEYVIELTLVNRDLMGFRMLLGRQALKGFMVHPKKSFIQST